MDSKNRRREKIVDDIEDDFVQDEDPPIQETKTLLNIDGGKQSKNRNAPSDDDDGIEDDY